MLIVKLITHKNVCPNIDLVTSIIFIDDYGIVFRGQPNAVDDYALIIFDPWKKFSRLISEKFWYMPVLYNSRFAARLISKCAPNS